MINNNHIVPIKTSSYAYPIVPIIKNNNKIRLCVDFKSLNNQLITHQFPIPQIDEIISSLGKCKFLSKLDLSNAYLQLKISKESQKYLVMSTHKGLYKFVRLPFGLSSSPGIFQK